MVEDIDLLKIGVIHIDLGCPSLTMMSQFFRQYIVIQSNWIM